MKSLSTKSLSTMFLACILMLTTFTFGCSQAQFIAVLNEVGPAVTDILEIVALVRGTPADTSLATKISGDVSDVETLYTSYQAASAASKPGIEADINNGFSVLNSDLTQVFQLAKVSDVNTQAKVTALIGLVQTGVTIAESLIPVSAARYKATAPTSHLSAADLVTSYNHILVAKTGNKVVDAYTPKHKLHFHTEAVRVLSLGHAS